MRQALTFSCWVPKLPCWKSNKPVIAICAVRTGVGKEPDVQKDCRHVDGSRAPGRCYSPSDALCQFWLSKECSALLPWKTWKKHDCTIEEMEEYETAYRAWQCDLCWKWLWSHTARCWRRSRWLWYHHLGWWKTMTSPLSSLTCLITMLDPHRPGHELRYYPSEVNLKMADVLYYQ